MKGATASSASKKRAKRVSPIGWLGLAVFLVAGLGAVLGAFTVARGEPPSAKLPLEEAVRKGPDSYFHHVFDPDGVLEGIGGTDLELDNFERETSHGILFGALKKAPEDVAGFTMHAAEVWAPGVRGADNGVIIFIFPEDRHVRAEVGYGLEAVLPDVVVKRLIESYLVPALKAGEPLSGVEAIVPPLFELVRGVPRATPKRVSFFGDLAVTAQEIPRKARLVWGVWLANPPGPRILISTVLAGLVTLFAVLIARVVQCLVLVVRRFSARRDAGRRVSATLDLTNSLLRLAQLVAILFVMLVGTSFFFPGTGGFGGAGVDVFW